MDVAIVEGNAAAGQPLLLALYAANSDPLKSTVGPTEVRCYKLEPDGTTSLFAAVDLPSDGPGGLDAVGMALDSDPADPDNVYVALGTAWLWKVTIQTSPTLALVPTQVSTPAAILLCTLSPCPDGEAMTDIDFVHVPLAGPVVQGRTVLSGVPVFGDGVRCTGGNQLRLQVASAQAGQSWVPDTGAPSLRARAQAAGDPLLPGSVRYYQAVYRDPAPGFCAAPTGGTFNTTNGVRVVW